MIIKLNLKLDWKERYKNQSERIKKWIEEDCKIEKTYEINKDDNSKKSFFYFEEYLRGTDIAGIGQGRFTKNAKDKVKKNWEDIKKSLSGVKDAKIQNQDNQQKDYLSIEGKNANKELFKEYEGLFGSCEKLQKELITNCKKTTKPKKEDEEIKEVEEHKPWAAIHAMIVALQPKVFCTIVSEKNIDELYQKLYDVADSDDADSDVVDSTDQTIDLIFGTKWDALKEAWKEANSKKIKDRKMSWYYKSVAIQNYFKDIVGKTDEWEYMNYPWATLVALRGEENIKMMAYKLEKQKNLILTGAPGTGKTYLAKQIASRLIFEKIYNSDGSINNNLKRSGQYEFVQFHPSYDYTDFVEGLRPNESGNSFTRMDGIFKEFCAIAAIAEKEDNEKVNEKDKRKFVFVIDEINRGEISKIFGELFFSIDPGYRGEIDKDGNDNKVKTQYQNLITKAEKVIIKKENNTEEKEYPFVNGFYVPNNVFVIGTMNDIDRSVESMDFAFRRRFAFVEISAEDSVSIVYSADENKGWDSNTKQTAVDSMNSLNTAIVKKCGLTAQYQIGGAYFLKLEDVKFDYRKLWNDYLKGTLYEYFRGLPANEINDKIKQLEDAYYNGIDDEIE